MLLDEYQERLFVGGKDLVYSLSLEHISSDYQEVRKYQTVFQEGKKRCEVDTFLPGYYLDEFRNLSDNFIERNKVFLSIKLF